MPPLARQGNVFIRDFVQKLLALALISDAAQKQYDRNLEIKNPDLERLRVVRQRTKPTDNLTKLLRGLAIADGKQKPGELASAVLKAIRKIATKREAAGDIVNWVPLLRLDPSGPDCPHFVRDHLLRLLFSEAAENAENWSVTLTTKHVKTAGNNQGIPQGEEYKGCDAVFAMLAGSRIAEPGAAGAAWQFERTTPGDDDYRFDVLRTKLTQYEGIAITEVRGEIPLRLAYFFGFCRGRDEDHPVARLAGRGPADWGDSWTALDAPPLARESAWRAFAGQRHVTNGTEYWGDPLKAFVEAYCRAVETEHGLWLPDEVSGEKHRRTKAGAAADGRRGWVLERPTQALPTHGGKGELDYRQEHVHLDCRVGFARGGKEFGFLWALAELTLGGGLRDDLIDNLRPEFHCDSELAGKVLIRIYGRKPPVFLIHREDGGPLPNGMLFVNNEPAVFSLREPVGGGKISLRLMARASDIRDLSTDVVEDDSGDMLHRVALAGLIRYSMTGQTVDGKTIPLDKDDTVILDRGDFVFARLGSGEKEG